MTLSSKSFVLVASTLFISASLSSYALARNLDTLARLLIPAYMAQDFAALCSTHDSQFLLGDLKYGVVSINSFAEHVKREVTVDLPENDAAKVRLMAADTARDVARKELRSIIDQRTVNPVSEIDQWCDRSARPFILEIITKHEERHRDFDATLEGAKH